MFLILLLVPYLGRWTWTIISTPLYLVLWILFSLGPFLYVLHKTKHIQVTPELEKRYDAFYRTDIGKRKNFRFYLLYLVSFIPRYIVAWIAILTYCSLIMIIMIGTN